MPQTYKLALLDDYQKVALKMADWDRLKKRGVEITVEGKTPGDVQMVIGLATQFSVEHTVRDAADLGYFVTLVADCCASADGEAHRATLRTLTMLADVVESASLV